MVPPVCHCAPPDEHLLVRTTRHADEEILQTVLRAVAACTNTSITELEPLYEQVEPDALDTLLGHAVTNDAPVSIAFELENLTVNVTDDERVCVYQTA